MSHGHVVKVNSVLQTESGIVVEGEKVPRKILAKILDKKEMKMMETMKKMPECKEWTSVECNWSANLANKMPPISKMCLVDGQGGTVLFFVNNENLVVASGLVDKSMVDVGCLELLEKSQEKMRRQLEENEELHLAKLEEEDAKRKEEDAKRCQRKARNEENELRRREEERKLMESREKGRSARSLASKFEQGKVAFFAKDWGR